MYKKWAVRASSSSKQRSKACRHREPRTWPRQRRLSCESWPPQLRLSSRAPSSAGRRPAARHARTASAAAASGGAAPPTCTAAPAARASAPAAPARSAPAWGLSCRETCSSGCSSTATTRRAPRAGSTPTAGFSPRPPRSRPSARRAATSRGSVRSLRSCGQTSHETTGGWPTAPDGPFSWGYCVKQERDPPSDYCEPRPQWPCAPGKKYFGRGPIQLSFNYNYGPAGRAIGVDLLNNPDLVATGAVVSFKTALWFWMTPRDNKPSCHAVITGQWTPTAADRAASRAPGYGVINNIINGGLECGRGPDPQAADRVGFYKRYCDVFGIGYGSDLDCDGQSPFNAGSSSGLAAAQ